MRIRSPAPGLSLLVALVVLCAVAPCAVAELATGTYTGNGLDNRAITGLGFQPDLVLVKGDVTEFTICRTASMSGDMSKPLAADAPVGSNMIQAFLADGFVVGSAAATNLISKRYDWIALRAEPGEMAFGEYIGSGLDNHDIAGVGFRPDLVIVMSEGNKAGWVRTPYMVGDLSTTFRTADAAPNRIQLLQADGFQVGNDAAVNSLFTRYHWVAWRALADHLSVGYYLGDATDDRAIDGVGFPPQYVLLTTESGTGAIHRPASLGAGDVSLTFDNTKSLIDAIQALTPDGFQVGSRDEVNKSGKLYHYVAFGQPEANADLGVTKSASAATAAPGDRIGFTIALNNAGPAATTGVRVSDLLPAGLTFESAIQSQGTYTSASGIWEVGALADGAGAILVVNARAEAAAAGHALVNTASIASSEAPDPDPTDNSSSTSVSIIGADLRVDKTVDPPGPNEGETVIFTVTVANDGPQTTSGVSVADPLPAGLDYVAATATQGLYLPGTGEWWIGTLGATAEATLTLTARVAAGTSGQTIVNTAAITATSLADPSPANNSDSATIIVNSSDLSLVKTVDLPRPAEGAGVVFTLALTNQGAQPVPGIAVADTLPPGLVYLGATPSQGVYDPATGLWDVGALAAGAAATLDVAATVATGTGGHTLVNRAQIAARGLPDPNPDNDVATAALVVRGADLALAKTVDDPLPNEGGPVAYVVSLANAGPDDAAGVAVDDPLPAGLLLVDATPETGAYDPGSGLWAVGALAAGDTVRLVLRATVGAATGGATIVNRATVTAADLPDPVPANNAAAASLIVQSADLALALVADRPTPVPGDTLVFTLSLANAGPTAATGVTVVDQLPEGLAFVSATPDRGGYDAGSALWTVGALAADDTVGLRLRAVVESGATGRTLVNTAAIVATDQADPDPANNTATLALTVPLTDLRLALTVDDAAPPAGGGVTFTVALVNAGVDAATGVAVADTLPSGLAFTAAAATRGAYDPATGLWTLGTLAAGAADTLRLTAAVASDAGSLKLVNAARARCDQADADPTNDAAAVEVTPRSSDLALTLVAADPSPLEGAVTTLRLAVRNQGPSPAAGVTITDTLAPGLTRLGAAPTRGVYDDAAGRWDLGLLAAGDSASLELAIAVGATAGGSTLRAAAAALAADPPDPFPANDGAATQLRVRSGTVTARAAARAARAVRPRERVTDLLRLELASGAAVPETLTALTLANLGVGPGTPAQLDGAWAGLELLVDSPGGPRAALTSPGGVATGRFADGRLLLTGLAEPLAPGDTLRLTVAGDVSLAARDGDLVETGLVAAGDIAFAPTVITTATWPLRATGALTVDGFIADQIVVHPVPGAVVPVGSRRRPALDLTLPANGYAADRLARVEVVNLGDAAATDLAALEAWADDGDGLFSAATDARLGALAYTGDRWTLSGLARDVPPGGLRLFVTLDAAADATEGRTVRLAVPGPPEPGVAMASANDGPLDHEVANPDPLVLAGIDRVALAATPLAATPLSPGAADAPLLRLSLANPDTLAHDVTALTVTNASLSVNGGRAAELDAAITRLTLRIDGDDDGVLDDAGSDAVLAEATFAAGRAAFTGFRVALTPGASAAVWVVADLSRTAAADGDIVAVTVAAADDVTVVPATRVVGGWPLDSGAHRPVDGMTAAQLSVTPQTPAVLGPGDGPALALDLVVPANGYAPDALRSLELRNAGNATAADLADVRLWRDGGDGRFTPGAGDDTELAPLVPVGAAWLSPLLDAPVPVGGLRCFVGVIAAATPGDSAVVRLFVPVGGLTLASANDGPLDAPVAGGADLAISTSPLQALLAIEPAASSTGQAVTLRMTVRNAGADPLRSVAPAAPVVTGDGALALGAPTPAGLDLAPGESATFTWTAVASAPGDLRVTAAAAGTSAADGSLRRALPATSNPHRVWTAATQLAVFPAAGGSFTVTRGQTNVVPLTLTLVNPGGAAAAPVRLGGLRVRLEDADGAGIPPASLLSRIVVSEGTNTYLDRSDLETSGAEIALALAQPAIVTGSEPATLGLRLDISASTTVANFRLAVADSSWLTAADLYSGAPLPVILGEGNYPIRSGLGTVQAPALRLEVAAAATADTTAGPGQADLPLLDLALDNPGVPGLSRDLSVVAVPLSLVGPDGVAIADPATRLGALRARCGGQLLAERPLGAADDTLLTLLLSLPLTVPAATPVTLSISGDIASAAPPDAWRLRLGPPALFTALDRGSGEAVPVTYADDPTAGGLVQVQSVASRLDASGRPLLPPLVTVGSRGLGAIAVTLRHPGPSGAAAVVCDTLRLVCRDQNRVRLPAADYVDRVTVRRAGALLATATPQAGSAIAAPLAGLRLAAGACETLTVLVDIETAAPAGYLELDLDASGLDARDANLGSAIALAPATGAELPLTSGLARLQPPADALTVALADAMPPVVAADGTAVTVARFAFTNPAPPGAGAISLAGLTVRAADRDFATLAAGTVLRSLRLLHQAGTWAVRDSVPAVAATVTLSAASPLTLEPGMTVELELLATFAAGAPVTGVRLGIDRDDVTVLQPGGALLAVRVEPAAGAAFPLWTDAGTPAAGGLAESWANFPNPFAAGREATAFVYDLPLAGVVSLRLFTPRGEPVVTLLADVPRAAGLHQDDHWDGRNGRGEPVQNGVYVAELKVRLDDGTTRRLLRKVAVVR